MFTSAGRTSFRSRAIALAAVAVFALAGAVATTSAAANSQAIDSASAATFPPAPAPADGTAGYNQFADPQQLAAAGAIPSLTNAPAPNDTTGVQLSVGLGLIGLGVLALASVLATVVRTRRTVPIARGAYAVRAS